MDLALFVVQDDQKVVKKRKTELGGMFSTASWILFIGPSFKTDPIWNEVLKMKYCIFDGDKAHP